MRPLTKLFRLLVAVALIWMVSMLVVLMTTRNLNIDDCPVKDLRKRSVSQGMNLTAAESESIMKGIADRVAGNDTLVDILVEDLLKSSAVRQRLTSLVNTSDQTNHRPKWSKRQQTSCSNVSADARAAWPAKAKPGDYGYGGAGVTINTASLSPREKEIFDNGYSTYKVNQLASDRIPLRREIHLNMPECRSFEYDINSLPRAGVVLIFHNELWSVLLRTVYSILDAGPDQLITEVILVDDASTKEYLGTPLEDYLAIFRGKVKLLRLPKREGLIKARLLGFDHVTGDVAVFLDAHCEVHKGWLEPLLQRIKDDDTVVAVPSTDRINWDTFHYEFKSNKQQERGGFDFDMNFNWIRGMPVDGVNRKSLVDPVKSATHLGCCFAISKNNFERLGRYDPGLEIWGCENLELSFKTWMCGGRLEIVPCSHIGHMYRPAFPYTWGDHAIITLIRNCLRVAEVWLDDYKLFFYERIGNMQGSVNIGDISERKALRERLQCRSFHWYVKEIYPELYVPVNTTATGRISSVAVPGMCIQRDMHWASLNQPPEPKACNVQDQNQHFLLSKDGQFRRDQGCLAFDMNQRKILMKICDDVTSRWEYTKENLIKSVEGQLCVTLSTDSKLIHMRTCNAKDPRQQWRWPRRSVILHV